MVDGSLNFDTRIDTKGFAKGTNTIKGMAGGLTSIFKKIGIALAGAFAVGKIVQVGKEAINFASDLQEVQNVVDTAFGDMSYKMEEFADKAIENYGISKLTAKQMGSTYMAMAKGMGQAADIASDSAIEITGRLGDIMSFYNKTASEADTIGRAVYSGETEPLKQIGIIMTETNLEAYALSKGYGKLYKEMSSADKLMVRQQYFLEQTNMAAGDFVKTQYSWANQTRILQERWKEFLGIIGSGLIQVLTPAVQFLNNAMSKLIEYATLAGQVLSKLFGLESTAEAVGSSASAAGAGIGEMADETAAANKKISKSLSGFDELNNLSQSTAQGTASNSIAGTVATGGDINVSGAVEVEDKATPIVELIKAKLEKFKGYLDTVFTPGVRDAFGTLGTSIWNLRGSFEQVFSDIWNIVILPWLNTMLTVALPMMGGIVGQMALTWASLIDAVKSVFDRLWSEAVTPSMSLIMSIWQGAWSVLQSTWDKWGAPIFENIRTAFNNVKDTVLLLWETTLEPIWDTFMRVVEELWVDHLKPFLANFMDFIGEIVNGALDIYNKFITPVVNWFIEYFGPRIAVAFETVLMVVKTIIGGIIDVASGIIDVFKGIIQFIVGVFTGDWRKALTGIFNIFKGIWNAIEGVVKTVVNSIIYIINGMIRGICTGINSVIRAINSIGFTMPDWVPGFGGERIGFNLKEVTVPQIPKLATGAVIPPNSEFLAILGDQKRGTNIEAPLETILDAMRMALTEMGINVTFQVEGDPNGLFKVIRKEAKKHTNRTGEPAFSV